MSHSQRVLDSYAAWKALTTDTWVLNTVQGYQIHFDNIPSQSFLPKEITFSPEEQLLVDKEVQNMSDLGAIVPSQNEDGQFISNIFLVPKPNNKFRPVINLKALNEFVHYEHFKQETFPYVLELIEKDEYFVSLDLKSAYFSIPIHPDSQKYLKFIWRNHVEICLPSIWTFFSSFCFHKGFKTSICIFQANRNKMLLLYR